MGAIRGSLVEQVEGVVWPVDLLSHDALRLKILDMSIRVLVAVGNASVHSMATVARSLEGQGTTRATARCQRSCAKRSALLYWRGVVEVVPFAAISDDVFVVVFFKGLVTLPLAARGAEKAFFALATAADTWRVVWIVDTTEVAPDLSPAAWNTCLVDALVLGIEGRVARSAS